MADPGVIHLIHLIGRRKHATPMELKSAFETGLVESNLENLPGGSGDSAGWRQERASLYSNPTNLEASINRYFDEARAFRGKYSRAGDLAAAVQRPRADLRGKYQQRSGDADALLARLGVGGGSGSGGGGGVVSAQVPQQGSSFDPGPQSLSTLAGLISQQAPPPVQAPQAPHAVIQSPVVNAQPPSDSGVSGLLDAIRTPAQDLPTGGQQGSVKVSVRGPTATAASMGPSRGGSKLLEMFYNGPGGINVKNGQREPRGFVSGHTDHVHVAAGPKTIVAVGNLAQQMGLHVGENPHFGGVNPVHVKDSYHYKNQAIDVSGDPALMRRFNHTVARRFGVGR